MFRISQQTEVSSAKSRSFIEDDINVGLDLHIKNRHNWLGFLNQKSFGVRSLNVGHLYVICAVLLWSNCPVFLDFLITRQIG